MSNYTLKIRGGVEVDSGGKRAGKGPLIQKEKSGTLGVSQDQTLIQVLNDQGGSVMNLSEDKSGALRASEHGHQPIVFDGSRRHNYEEFNDKCETVQAAYGTGGGNTPIVLNPDQRDKKCFGLDHVLMSGGTTFKRRGYYEDKSGCLKTQPHGVCETPSEPVAFSISSYESNAMKSDNPKSGVNETETARTLDLNGGDPSCNQGGVAIVYGESSFGDYTDKHIGTLKAQGGHNGGGSENLLVSESCQETVGALCSGISKGTSNQIINQDQIIAKNATVRRLTPLECERLQGFPDGWTDIGSWTDTKGKVHKESSDTARYKALGNSIAVGYANEQKGFWIWLMKRISEQYNRVATLGSLFDGIGGFPLAWEYCNGKGSAIWASEIEEFPIAVTKYHFPEGSEIDV